MRFGVKNKKRRIVLRRFGERRWLFREESVQEIYRQKPSINT
jgi:hypothetical protein